MGKRLFGLKPKINSKTRILILGSFPGKMSLDRKQYYANNNNQFWRIIFDLFNEKPEHFEYDSKIKFLQKNKIGLWDVIGSCRREGSSDNAIKDVKLNDIAGLLTRYPNIEALFLNGQKAHMVLTRNQDICLKTICLPSTSPAYTMAYNDKKRVWMTKIKKVIV